MSTIDVRVAVAAALAGLCAAAGTVPAGGGVLAMGLLTGILVTRSAFRREEADVTVAIVVGGIAVALSTGHGRAAAVLAVLGLFVGCELAALARVLAADADAPARTDVAATLLTISTGIAAGAAVLTASVLRAGPVLANVALVLASSAALAGLAIRSRRSSGGSARNS